MQSGCYPCFGDGNKKERAFEKRNMQKYYCDNDFAKTNYNISIHEQSVNCYNSTLPHDIGSN